jgi:hypothetical protein
MLFSTRATIAPFFWVTPPSIAHPFEFGAVATVIGQDVTDVRVEWTYGAADAEPPLNEVWADCAACRRPQNHKR